MIKQKWYWHLLIFFIAPFIGNFIYAMIVNMKNESIRKKKRQEIAKYKDYKLFNYAEYEAAVQRLFNNVTKGIKKVINDENLYYEIDYHESFGKYNIAEIVKDDKSYFMYKKLHGVLEKCDKIKIRKNGDDQLCLDVYKDSIYTKENVTVDDAYCTLVAFEQNGEVPNTDDYIKRGYIIDMDAYKKLTEMLVNDEKIKKELFDFIDDPLYCCKKDEEFLEDFFVDEEEVEEEIEELIWLYYVWKLEEADVVISFDWKEDPKSIVTLIEYIIPNNNLTVTEEEVNSGYTEESGCLEEDLGRLNKKWETFGYSIVELYQDNDAYNLMILKNEKIVEVQKLLKSNNQKIIRY